jgi:hypothetical protein
MEKRRESILNKIKNVKVVYDSFIEEWEEMYENGEEDVIIDIQETQEKLRYIEYDIQHLSDETFTKVNLDKFEELYKNYDEDGYEVGEYWNTKHINDIVSKIVYTK